MAAAAEQLSPSGAVIDLLFASSGIEPEIVAAAEEIEILDGLKVPVARPILGGLHHDYQAAA